MGRARIRRWIRVVPIRLRARYYVSMGNLGIIWCKSGRVRPLGAERNTGVPLDLRLRGGYDHNFLSASRVLSTIPCYFTRKIFV